MEKEEVTRSIKDRVIERVVEGARKFKRIIRREYLEDEIAELRKKLDEAKQEIATKTQAIQRLSEEKEKLKKAKEEAKEKWTYWKSRADGLERERNDLQESIIEKDGELEEKLEYVKKLETEVSKLSSELENAKTDLSRKWRDAVHWQRLYDEMVSKEIKMYELFFKGSEDLGLYGAKFDEKRLENMRSCVEKYGNLKPFEEVHFSEEWVKDAVALDALRELHNVAKEEILRLRKLVDEKFEVWELCGLGYDEKGNDIYTFVGKTPGDEVPQLVAIPATLNFSQPIKFEKVPGGIVVTLPDLNTREPKRISYGVYQCARKMIEEGKVPHQPLTMKSASKVVPTPERAFRSSSPEDISVRESREEKIYAAVKERGKIGEEITLGDLEAWVSVGREKLYMALNRLGKKKLCERVGRGIYVFK